MLQLSQTDGHSKRCLRMHCDFEADISACLLFSLLLSLL